MRTKRAVSEEALMELVDDLQAEARRLLDEDPGRARGYAEAAMELAYTFGLGGFCQARGEAFAPAAGSARGRAARALQRAAQALRALVRA
jgi:hypothetical protein